MPPIPERPPRLPSDLLRGNRTVFLGDSLTQSDQDNAAGSAGSTIWPNIASFESGGRLRYVRNAGVAGNRTSHMLARFDADVLAYAPDLCVILGGTNDFNQVTLSETKTNIQALVARCRGARIAPILCTVPPNSGDGVDKTNHDLFNHWLREYAARNGYLLADMAALTTDPSNGNWVDGMVVLGQDPTHPVIGGTGHLKMAEALVSSIVPLPVHPWPLTQYKGEKGNLLPNGVFVGDANTDGFADGYTLVGDTQNRTGELVSDAGNVVGNWQQITRSSGASVFYLQSGDILTGWSVGDRLQFSGRFSFSRSDSTSSIAARVEFNGATGSPAQIAPLNTYTKTTTGGVFCWDGLVPAGTTSISVKLFASAGTNVCRFGQLTLLNLTTLGVV